jgi:hypothetical protein
MAPSIQAFDLRDVRVSQLAPFRECTKRSIPQQLHILAQDLLAATDTLDQCCVRNRIGYNKIIPRIPHSRMTAQSILTVETRHITATRPHIRRKTKRVFLLLSI